jgi:hypothetical protein
VKAEPLSPSAVIAFVETSLRLQGHAGRRVVRDSTAWRRVWEEAYSGISPAPPLPEVDFSRDMVLAVAFGSVRVEDGTTIDSVGISKHQVVAVVRIEKTCGFIRDIQSPTLLVRLPLAPQVRFVERRRGSDCFSKP